MTRYFVRKLLIYIVTFVVAVTITSLLFWSLLGALAGLLRPRVEAWLAAPKGRLA